MQKKTRWVLGDFSPPPALRLGGGRPRASARRFLRNFVSGDDVGGNLIGDDRNPVAQLQLAFFQALQLQQIGGGRALEGVDRGVEVAVFLSQAGQFGREFAIFVVVHDLRWLGLPLARRSSGGNPSRNYRRCKRGAQVEGSGIFAVHPL